MSDTVHRCTILIVEDDREVQEVLRVALTADGFDVAAAASGREALDHLRSHADTCAILLDLMMPGMQGTEFRRLQLRDRSLAWIPVVVLSGAIDAERLAREAGIGRVLRKPLDLDQIRRTLGLVTRNNCRNGGRTAELAARKQGPLSSG
jgi:CheY-like chemotaxis protein